MADGTYLVTAVEADSAVLRDVDSGQIHAVADPPDLEVDEVVAATLETGSSMEATDRVASIDDRREITVAPSEESPTKLARELAAEAETGTIAREERAGDGELHVLSLPPAVVDSAAEDVLADGETLARAARLDVGRVEVRTGEGVVSVRYLP